MGIPRRAELTLLSGRCAELLEEIHRALVYCRELGQVPRMRPRRTKDEAEFLLDPVAQPMSAIPGSLWQGQFCRRRNVTGGRTSRTGREKSCCKIAVISISNSSMRSAEEWMRTLAHVETALWFRRRRHCGRLSGWRGCRGISDRGRCAPALPIADHERQFPNSAKLLYGSRAHLDVVESGHDASAIGIRGKRDSAMRSGRNSCSCYRIEGTGIIKRALSDAMLAIAKGNRAAGQGIRL
jgi:hypothetical protein